MSPWETRKSKIWNDFVLWNINSNNKALLLIALSFLIGLLILIVFLLVVFLSFENIKTENDDNTREEPLILTSPLEMSDIFISVKTSFQFHQNRIPIILSTWFTLAHSIIWFFTDDFDEELSRKTNNHVIVTQCGSSHARQALCCKMSAEFDAFLASSSKWFCHFDDDNYVNVFALLRMLRNYDYKADWYLGKPSLPEPLEIQDKDNKKNKLHFWFATGGAGFCLSRTLAEKMSPVAGFGRFKDIGNKIRLPDDVTMGYIIEHMLGIPLTTKEEFHSHLEPQRFISTSDSNFENQISFGYHVYGNEMNAPEIPNSRFSSTEDPTSFKGLHCLLFPNFIWCPS